MKKLLVILLSVVFIGSVGCGSNKDWNSEAVKATEEPAKGAASVEIEETEQVGQKSTEIVKEKDADWDDQLENKVANDKSAENNQTAKNNSSYDQKTAEQPKDIKSESMFEQLPKLEENSKSEEKPEPQAVAYSPDRVVSLAISKCQSGGMVTTEQHLRDNLNAGKITKEEYDEYYPMDGLDDSYYSVFVNVDLSKAATTSGRTLGSEEEIAQYIAEMLLLESDSVFNIRYNGTTKTSSEIFNEFRCYR